MPHGETDLNKVIENSIKKYAGNPCLGTREKSMVEEKDEEGNVKSNNNHNSSF